MSAELATEVDTVHDEDMDLDVVARTGAQAVELDHLTHCWMLEDSDRGAEVLIRFRDSRPA
ncbi:hypothetical protein [Streptomyces coelicoflavus]|uniref:hypothetical protein n=1 Tax=Streptomyces coelicoflavus TaxID=285562 RepID=UPI002E2599C2